MNRTIVFCCALCLLFIGTISTATETTTSPPAAVQIDGTLNVVGTLSNGYVHTTGPNLLYLEVNVVAGSAAEQDRVPLNLAIVIDRSGSMAGIKLDDSKTAAAMLVDALVEGDKIALVVYDTNVQVLVGLTDVTADSKKMLKEKIAQIRDLDSTNLSGGLEAGRDELLKDLRQDGINRIILLSDGKANKGVSDVAGLSRIAEDIERKGITITTMGVGTDYDESIMSAVAEMGGGNYYFIGSDLPKIFAQEMDTLKSTVAMEAHLELILEDGVTLADVYGYNFSTHQNSVIIPLHNFWANRDKSVLIGLQVPSDRLGTLEIGELKIAYHDVEKNQAISQKSAKITVECTGDTQVVQTNRNLDVEERAEQIQIAATYEEALELYENGKREEAAEVVRKQREQTVTNNQTIKSEELETEINQLEDLERDILTVDHESKEGKARTKKSKKRAEDQQKSRTYEEDANVDEADIVY